MDSNGTGTSLDSTLLTNISGPERLWCLLLYAWKATLLQFFVQFCAFQQSSFCVLGSSSRQTVTAAARNNQDEEHPDPLLH